MDRYYWWKVTDLLDFFVMLIKASFDVGPQNVRVEFHPKDPNDLWLKIATVVDGKREVCGEYDFGHTCPPDCE